MNVFVRIEAMGPMASGKTYELERLKELLASRGYEVVGVSRDETGYPHSEILEMSREGIVADQGGH